MANPRIDDLRKRLEKEPGSRIFAQLAEELRKDGDLEEAIQVCREGLQKHANYPSARMTLGRALFESGDLAAARREFEVVLKGAPDNILAGRLLGESLEGLGELEAARDRFKATLAMAPGEKHVAAQLEAVERALKKKAPPAAATPAPTAAREPPAEPRAPLEPPPIKVVEVNEPMELERPHEVPTVSFRLPETPPPATPEPPRPVAQEEVVEFDEAPTLVGTATEGAVPAPQAPPAEEELPTTLPLSTRAPTFPEPGPPPAAEAPSEPAPPPSPAPTVFTSAPARAPEPPPEVEPEVEPEPQVQPEPKVEAEQPAEPPAAPPPAMPETPSEVKAPVSEPAPTEEIASVTLAELYFNQGFVDKAVAVLKQLVIREPGNERARARLNEIEAREAGLQVEQAQVAAATGPGVDQRALRRQAIERTIAQLEKMLKAVRKG